MEHLSAPFFMNNLFYFWHNRIKLINWRCFQIMSKEKKNNNKNSQNNNNNNSKNNNNN